MSLHSLASHLQDAGRGDDKVLVHMTPHEVGGLQALAKAHGGSLTTNPETGLPEAGFLSSILPTIAGILLAPETGGASLGLTEAWQTAAVVGGATGLATGSLTKGLMAGLGAYGGAGMAGDLSQIGASALGSAGESAGSAAADAAGNLGVTGGGQTMNATSLRAAQDAAANTAESSAAAMGPVNPASGGFNAYNNSLNAQALNQGPFANTPVNASSYTAQLPQATEVPLQAPTPVAQSVPSSLYQSDAVKAAEAAGDVAPSAQSADPSRFDKLGAGFKQATSSGKNAWEFVKSHPMPFIGAGLGLLQDMSKQPTLNAAPVNKGMIRPYTYDATVNQAAFAPTTSSAERYYYNEPRFTAQAPYAAKDGGLMSLQKYAVGGPVEQMSAQNAIGDNTMYPQSQLQTSMYSNPMVQRPMPSNVITAGTDTATDPYTGEQKFAVGGMANGGYNLGSYSDGGRLLKGPGDGVSDSIPASIGRGQPARLADGEFVVPARIVSEIGNGSTEAGARKLYAMMDRVQKARGKTVGKNKVAVNSKAAKYLPA